jgi:hypothetical protein
VFALQTTEDKITGCAGMSAQELLEEELATLTAHINAATARWIDLVAAALRDGGVVGEDVVRWLAFRCGITTREAREYVRVADALQELPSTRAAFSRGELTFAKVRALTRVATPSSETGLLELAGALTASQLERALRAFRRVGAEEARDTHELEYVDYYWGDDGSLFLRARLAAEDGTLLVRALEAARERVRERHSDEQAANDTGTGFQNAARQFEPPRSLQVEALVELAEAALASRNERSAGRAHLVVHVDAAALTAGGSGRSELEDGPVISVETARRLGCDAPRVTVTERDGLPVSVGRSRRTVPPKLRRLLEARDDRCCRWPGCENRRHLDAHHRRHWALGGETSLENLVLLCSHHHRLVHEGGYTLENGPSGELRFRNRHGLLCPVVPRSPPGSPDDLVEQNEQSGLTMGPKTNRNGYGDALDLQLAVAAVEQALAARDLDREGGAAGEEPEPDAGVHGELRRLAVATCRDHLRAA